MVDLLYQQHMAESIILFIEDELDHFEAVREHLEPDFKCARSHGLQIEMVAEEIEDLRPVVVVLDLMLFSSHRAAKAGMAACRRSIALLESRLGNKLAPTRPTRREDDSNETPVMASDWLRELKGYVREYRLLPSLNWRPLRIRSENSLQMPLPNAWI